MAIFSEFFGDVITLMIRVNADKRIKENSDIFSIKNLDYTFVCFLSIQSLREMAGNCLYVYGMFFAPFGWSP